MAKKKSQFNMAAEIRSLIEKNRSATGKEVITALKKKYPGQKINEASAGVAFSNARSKLGITRSVRKKKPGKRGASGKGGGAAAGTKVDLGALQAAKAFLAACGGDEKTAIAALRQLSSLQISG